MSVTPSSTIVGAFRDRALAERAVDALYGAGFENDQIQLSTSGPSGGLFEGLKNLFTGTPTSGGDNVVNDLANMGLSDAEAHYYSTEYKNGNTILIVRAPGRESEAAQLMWQYGAYNAGAPESTPAMQQPVESDPQSSFTPSGEYNIAQDWATEPQSSIAEAHPSTEPQPDYAADESDTSAQGTSPTAPLGGSAPQNTLSTTSVDETEAQNAHTPVTAVDDEMAPQNVQPLAEPVDEVAPQSVQSSVTAPEHDLDYQTAQPDAVTSSDSEEHHAAHQVTDMAAEHTTEEHQTAHQVTDMTGEHATNEQDIQASPHAYEPASLNGTANDAPPETSFAAPVAQGEVSTPVLEADATTMAAPVTEDDVTSQAAPVSAEQEAEMQAAQPTATASDQEQMTQTTAVPLDQEDAVPLSQTSVVAGQEAEIQPAQASVDTATDTSTAPTAQDMDVQAMPVSADTPVIATAAPATQESEVQPVSTPADTVTSDASTATVQDTGVQPAPADVASVGTTTTPSIQDTGMQSAPASAAPEQMDELEQLQAQIQTLRQQIEEAKAQLQAAKEREGQLKAARREQQLQAVRQQIQDLQAELQATQAELQETHTRLAQYQ